ncbi:MAG: hypothetical protein KDA86_08535 [Planctomycetaceae bacterium]|nr:hypothetical protein [Planctomycetaceae bacterium]
MTDTGPTLEERDEPSTPRWRHSVALIVFLLPFAGLLWVTNWYWKRVELFDGAEVKLAVPESKWLRLFGDEIAEIYFGDPIQLGIENEHLTPRQLKLIGSYKRLESLGLVGVSDDDLQYLGDLPNLEGLQIRSSHLTGDGLQHMAQLIKLERLVLQTPKLTDNSLEHLVKLKSLQDLRIETPLLTDVGLQHLEGAIWLQELHVSGGTVSEDGMQNLAGISTLAVLSLNNVEFKGDPFQPLAERGNIRHLVLNHSHVTDDMLEALARNDYLQHVLLIGTGVSPEACRKLDQAQPNLSVGYSLE